MNYKFSFNFLKIDKLIWIPHYSSGFSFSEEPDHNHVFPMDDILKYV